MVSRPLITEEFGTRQRSPIVDATDIVRKLVHLNGIQDGMVIVYVPSPRADRPAHADV